MPATTDAPVLSPADHEFFRENGYVIVHNAVPQRNLDAVIDLVWEFLEMDRNDPDDWYHEPHRIGGVGDRIRKRLGERRRLLPTRRRVASVRTL